MQIMDLGACLFGCCLNSHSVQFALALLRITVRHLWPKGKPRSTLSPQSSFVIIRPPCSSCSTSPISWQACLAHAVCRADAQRESRGIAGMGENASIASSSCCRMYRAILPEDLVLVKGRWSFCLRWQPCPHPRDEFRAKTLVQVPRRFCPPYTFLKAPCVSNSGDYDFLLL